MTWREVQAALLKHTGRFIDGVCPVCGERILSAVFVQHIEEEHPEVADRIRKATGGDDEN